LRGQPIPSNGPSIIRNSGATVYLSNEAEWYKAAYHQPSSAGGDRGDIRNIRSNDNS
jgi:hypothetical protein